MVLQLVGWVHRSDSDRLLLQLQTFDLGVLLVASTTGLSVSTALPSKLFTLSGSKGALNAALALNLTYLPHPSTSGTEIIQLLLFNASSASASFEDYKEVSITIVDLRSAPQLSLLGAGASGLSVDQDSVVGVRFFDTSSYPQLSLSADASDGWEYAIELNVSTSMGVWNLTGFSTANANANANVSYAYGTSNLQAFVSVRCATVSLCASVVVNGLTYLPPAQVSGGGVEVVQCSLSALDLLRAAPAQQSLLPAGSAPSLITLSFPITIRSVPPPAPTLSLTSPPASASALVLNASDSQGLSLALTLSNPRLSPNATLLLPTLSITCSVPPSPLSSPFSSSFTPLTPPSLNAVYLSLPTLSPLYQFTTFSAANVSSTQQLPLPSPTLIGSSLPVFGALHSVQSAVSGLRLYFNASQLQMALSNDSSSSSAALNQSNTNVWLQCVVRVEAANEYTALSGVAVVSVNVSVVSGVQSTNPNPAVAVSSSSGGSSSGAESSGAMSTGADTSRCCVCAYAVLWLWLCCAVQ